VNSWLIIQLGPAGSSGRHRGVAAQGDKVPE
jgi:hypothetical protein